MLKKTGNLVVTPESALLTAAFNSRSSTVRFGAAAYDEKGRLIGVGWNGAVTPAEEAAARPLTTWLKKEAEKKGLESRLIHLVGTNGFYRLMHAEMRLFNNVAAARGKFSDIYKIETLRTVPVSANGQYYGVRKTDGGIWTTCAPCARVLEIPGTVEEMQTDRGWTPLSARETIVKATAERQVPRSFWEHEKNAFRAARKKQEDEDAPVIETEFMRWHRIVP